MGLGGTIVLIAVGAILTFATDWNVAGINLDVAGLIMMAVGFIGLAAYVSILKRRRVQPPPPGAPVVEVDDRSRYYG